MLGRLIQTAASYGKSNAALESATEEAHTRNLLYGQSQHVYSLAQSPPTSPFAAPQFRPGSFDDRGGFELEEKDVRILIAQDAYGAEERPTVLFDSTNKPAGVQTSPSHVRHASTAQAGSRSPLPSDWRPGALTSQNRSSPEMPFRNRSSTISSAPSAWTRQARDTGTREEAFLECMFGVTSSTKTTSTIKMHLIPGKQTPTSARAGVSGLFSDPSDGPTRRMPLVRSRTSNAPSRFSGPVLPTLDTDMPSYDTVLITRLFHIALPEPVGTKDQATSTSPTTNSAAEQNSNLESTSPGQSKKPKLVERKVPAFAIGLILHLPRSSASRPASTRPVSRAAPVHALSSAASSYGSDVPNSWNFLNAIPASLSSSRISQEDGDKRIEVIVNNWEVILRAISTLEREATLAIYEQLNRTLRQVSGPLQKAPKEKAMQRINQRVISITDPMAIAELSSLHRASRQTVRRICYALRVPRVVTGLGFAAGHWSDEARTLYRICGKKQQNFFLFNLITAFLGTHPQWLQRLAPDWYRRQFRALSRKRPEQPILGSRTVIVSDQRTLARRLIFVLASFLPASNGLDGLQKIGEDLALLGRFSTSSPSAQLSRTESLRRTANKRMRDHRIQSSVHDKSILSTSASSTDSTTPYVSRERPIRYLVRKDSDAVSIKGAQGLSGHETELRKTGAGTTSSITPNPTTPVAYFSVKNDSYFPEGALAETHESVASADLAKILRRSSSSAGNSSNVSSRWGSLVSGISDLWSSRHPHPGESGTITPYSPGDGAVDRRTPHVVPPSSSRHTSSLQDMVNELEAVNMSHRARPESSQSMYKIGSPPTMQSPFRPIAKAPKLKVDDKDGVIDVDLDLPNFGTLQLESTLSSPTKRTHRLSTASIMDGAESVRSLRSIPTLSPRAPVAEESSVAGYLRKHHEDFALHAVRPYDELEEDVKRAMSLEPSPLLDTSGQQVHGTDDGWTNICSTLIADIRTFTIKKIVLKRKLRRTSYSSTRGVDDETSQVPPKTVRRPTFSKAEEEFVEEEVKDFDTTLADAVERVLNLAEALQPPPMTAYRKGHARTSSNSTTLSSKTTSPDVFNSSGLSISQEYARQDCRQVVIGALEEIVKDVNDDLNKLQKGRDIHGIRAFDQNAVQRELKQDNLLREGVKKWLIDVEHAKV